MSTPLASLVAYLILLPFLSLLGYNSLRMYISKYNLNQTGIEMFLSRLSFPFSTLYKLSTQFLLDEDRDNIKTDDKSNIQYSRYIWGGICLVYIGAAIIGFSKQEESLPRASHLLFLSVAIPSLYISWKFGHNASVYKHYE